MDILGAADRYINVFRGRVPKSVLTRHYTDYSTEKLKRRARERIDEEIRGQEQS